MPLEILTPMELAELVKALTYHVTIYVSRLMPDR